MNHFIAQQILFFLIFFSISYTQNAISIDINGGVEFVVLDPIGRREGMDPIANQRFREINNSYGEFSVDSEDPDVDAPEPYNEFMADKGIDGLYRLTLFGTKPARYRLFIVVRSKEKAQGFDMFGLIDSNQVRVLEFTYSNDSTVSFVVKKLITATDLREDLRNCFKLGFLGGRSLFRELVEKVEHIEKRLERKDSSKAFEELEKLAKELKKVRDETEKHEGRKRKPSRFITKEAYDILNEDVTILMSSLPPRKHDKEDDDKEDRRKNEDRGDKKKSDLDKR